MQLEIIFEKIKLWKERAKDPIEGRKSTWDEPETTGPRARESQDGKHMKVCVRGDRREVSPADLMDGGKAI